MAPPVFPAAGVPGRSRRTRGRSPARPGSANQFESGRDYKAGVHANGSTALTSVVLAASASSDDSSLATLNSLTRETRVYNEPQVLRQFKDPLLGNDVRLSTSLGTSVSTSTNDSVQAVVRQAAETSFYAGYSTATGMNYSSYAYDVQEREQHSSTGTSLGCAISTSQSSVTFSTSNGSVVLTEQTESTTNSLSTSTSLAQSRWTLTWRDRGFLNAGQYSLNSHYRDEQSEEWSAANSQMRGSTSITGNAPGSGVVSSTRDSTSWETLHKHQEGTYDASGFNLSCVLSDELFQMSQIQADHSQNNTTGTRQTEHRSTETTLESDHVTIRERGSYAAGSYSLSCVLHDERYQQHYASEKISNLELPDTDTYSLSTAQESADQVIQLFAEGSYALGSFSWSSYLYLRQQDSQTTQTLDQEIIDNPLPVIVRSRPLRCPNAGTETKLNKSNTNCLEPPQDGSSLLSPIGS